jgi:hypothetical protein
MPPPRVLCVVVGMRASVYPWCPIYGHFAVVKRGHYSFRPELLWTAQREGTVQICVNTLSGTRKNINFRYSVSKWQMSQPLFEST